jgi:hypothetical protein
MNAAITAGIGTRAGWEARLCETGFMLRGHRLVRRRNLAQGRKGAKRESETDSSERREK